MDYCRSRRSNRSCHSAGCGRRTRTRSIGTSNKQATTYRAAGVRPADGNLEVGGKKRWRLPSPPLDSLCVGEIGQLSREGFSGIWISLPSSDGCPKVGPKSTVSYPGLAPRSTGTGTPPGRGPPYVTRVGQSYINTSVLGQASHRIIKLHMKS